MNTALNKLADELDMDPCELRLKNRVEPGGLANDSSPRPYSLDTMKERFQEVMDLMNWSQKWHRNGENNVMDDGRLHGIAISGHRDSHGGGPFPGRAAIVHMRGDGTAYINAGISRTGGGTNSAHCHIVAERLGLTYDNVNTGTYGDTGATADGGMQAASSNVTATGSAFYIAASDAREQLLATAAGMFDPPVNPEDLDAAENKIFLKSDETKFLSHGEVCARNSRIIGHATDNWGGTLTREHYGFPAGSPATQLPVCVSGAEVAVDPETGEIEILKLCYLTDIGRIIFHQGAYGQAEAGCDHVMAQAMYWDQIWDKSTGYMLNSYFWQSRFPTSLDLPIEAYDPQLREGDSANGPYGATGMGEPAAGNHNVISLAAANAIGEYITSGPLYPWKVIDALIAAGKKV